MGDGYGWGRARRLWLHPGLSPSPHYVDCLPILSSWPAPGLILKVMANTDVRVQRPLLPSLIFPPSRAPEHGKTNGGNTLNTNAEPHPSSMARSTKLNPFWLVPQSTAACFRAAINPRWRSATTLYLVSGIWDPAEYAIPSALPEVINRSTSSNRLAFPCGA